MDTKAKVVLAVGGVILAGMVAYVLLPGPKKPSAEELASQVKPETPATEPTSQPTTAATQAYDPFALPATAPAAGNSLPTGPERTDRWSVLDNGPESGRGSRTPAGRETVSPLAGDVESGRGPGTPKTWKVASGDSLASISTKVYGSPKYAAKIAAANPKANPKHLKAGQTLTLPEIPAATGVPAPSSSTPGSPETPALTGKTYKVVSGDSLRKISQKVYGNQGMWEKIYELNKKTIGSDPARLKVGMVLQLPEGGTH